MADLVVVQWTEDSKYKGVEQAVPRRCIQGARRNLVRGQEVGVQFGKSKSRVWKAIFVRNMEQEVEQHGGKQGGKKRGKVAGPVAATKRAKAKAKTEGEVNVWYVHADFVISMYYFGGWWL